MMELKRILARDIRAANEKAVAQYGADVLVISSSQVNGLTELIVAVDIPGLGAEDAEPFVKTDFTQSATEPPAERFEALLGQTLAGNKRSALERQSSTFPAVQSSPGPRAFEAHDSVRGREIVDLVREELASLRRELKLGQQVAAWQGGMPFAPALMPLRDALNDAPIPVALRALLIDSIKDHDNLSDALGALQRQLAHAVEQTQIAAPLHGVHVLAGPSGAGKSLMTARLAQAAALVHGSDQVMVISFHDHRAGAWHQTQLLNAQSGVNAFRAAHVGTVKLLLEEHEHRKLILIDTPGVQMNERLAELRSINCVMPCHAVVPADASTATLHRVFDHADNAWSSLMLSKLDEVSQPWALLQFLTEQTLSVSVASRGDGLNDLVQEVALADLVQSALDHLNLAPSDAVAAHRDVMSNRNIGQFQ